MRLVDAISSAGVGELDGDELGEGTCALYIHGPDADRLFATVEPILRASPLTVGRHAVRRYGDAGDPYAREERSRFGDGGRPEGAHHERFGREYLGPWRLDRTTGGG